MERDELAGDEGIQDSVMHRVDCAYCPWYIKGEDYSSLSKSLYEHILQMHPSITPNKMPEGQGKRDKERPRYDYVPLEFIEELVEIFAEGRRPRPGMPEGYGDSWMQGGEVFLRDCLNHAFWHLVMYMRGDRSENHLAKVAWNSLAVKWHVGRDQETTIDTGRDREIRPTPPYEES
jgi:dATP/dGTP diphosphohydrolase, N-terminal